MLGSPVVQYSCSEMLLIHVHRGLKKVLSSHLSQADFAVGQVTFPASLLSGQGLGMSSTD